MEVDKKEKKKKRLKTTYSPPLDLKPQLEFDEESAQALMEKPCRSFLTTSAAKFFPFLLVSPLLTLSYEPLACCFSSSLSPSLPPAPFGLSLLCFLALSLSPQSAAANSLGFFFSTFLPNPSRHSSPPDFSLAARSSISRSSSHSHQALLS